MNAHLTPLYVTLGLFSLGVFPLLIDNLRTGRATNRNNSILRSPDWCRWASIMFSGGINNPFG